MIDRRDFLNLPSGDVVAAGLSDLERGAMTTEGLLVLVGAPRLAKNGIAIPASDVRDPEHALYAALLEQHGDAAHSRYNALIRGLVSFERALECANR